MNYQDHASLYVLAAIELDMDYSEVDAALSLAGLDAELCCVKDAWEACEAYEAERTWRQQFASVRAS